MSESIWSGLIGHELIRRRLDAEVAHDRAAQAYLFTGADGLGKTTCALGLAQRLNCTGAAPPCGECAGCRAVALRVPTHVQVLLPEEQGGQGPVKPRLHKIDTIRDLLKATTLRALGQETRLFVIEAAEAMREETANALLKTLEEPPPRTVIVLCSEQPSALLTTILSRVRRYDFGPVAAGAIEQWLVDQRDIAPGIAAMAARVAGGRPGRAWRLASEPAAAQWRREALELALAVADRPAVAALRAAHTWLGGEDENAGLRIEFALDALEWWYRDALLHRTGADSAMYVNRDRLDDVEQFAARWSREELRASLTALQQARVSLRRNGNAGLVLEVLWLRLARGGFAAGSQ